MLNSIDVSVSCYNFMLASGVMLVNGAKLSQELRKSRATIRSLSTCDSENKCFYL